MMEQACHGAHTLAIFSGLNEGVPRLPARLHHMQYKCDRWQFSVETAAPFMITPIYETYVRLGRLKRGL